MLVPFYAIAKLKTTSTHKNAIFVILKGFKYVKLIAPNMYIGICE